MQYRLDRMRTHVLMAPTCVAIGPDYCASKSLRRRRFSLAVVAVLLNVIWGLPASAAPIFQGASGRAVQFSSRDACGDYSRDGATLQLQQ